MKPVFYSDRKTLITAGCFHEMKLESIDASILAADGTLVPETLFFACRCCPPTLPAKKLAASSKPAVATWQKWAVAT